MNTVRTVAVIIAATGLATTLVLPGRKTPEVVGSFWSGLTSWTKTAQGR